jgi:glutaredoxin 3
VQLARPLVQDELNVAERLEPGAEPRLRPSDPLGHRPDPPALERVEVEHAVGLAEPQRAQDDRFGLVTAARHAASVEARSVGKMRLMARVRLYTTRWCGYCVRAKALLEQRGIPYEEISLDDDPAFRQTIFDLTGRRTVPQIFIDDEPIGGYVELWRLDQAGQLGQLAA